MIWCLHGFLGLPSDWDLLPFPHRAPNLFTGGLAELEEATPDDILLGYSMGGRLALGELLQRRFRKAIIISSGLNLDEKREQRRADDDAWARRFEGDEPWWSLMKDWNTQPVFAGHEQPRNEGDFDRRRLAQALRDWSPGNLEPLAPRLGEIDIPVLWIAGERDVKYIVEGSRAVSLLPQGELWVCPRAGHRVPWERPEAFLARLRPFLE
ncbi:MAG TPA: alpha/beta fold hydrolase [Thermoanaerobaculia bacterium]